MVTKCDCQNGNFAKSFQRFLAKGIKMNNDNRWHGYAVNRANASTCGLRLLK